MSSCYILFVDSSFFFFFFQAEDGIRDKLVTGVQTCALPISCQLQISRIAQKRCCRKSRKRTCSLDIRGCDRNSFRQAGKGSRSEEHTSELQSLAYLVCRLLLEKKKKKYQSTNI